MDYSTLALRLEADPDGTLFDVTSLYTRLAGLTDSRKRRGKRYPLAVVLVLMVLAKLCGEEKPAGIAHWAHERQALFLETFELKQSRLPHRDTYTRVLGGAVVLDELVQTVREFLDRLSEPGANVQVTLDGKTVRGTIATGESRGLHLLAAYWPARGMVLMQVAVETKENEISAAPKVLKMLDLQGKIVTGDALLAQRELSQLIVEAGGDYVWTVKDNQPRLRQDIAQVFAPEHCVPGFSPAPKDFHTATTVDKGHGRLEVRQLTTSSLLNDTSDWPGLAQVFKLERTTVLLRTQQTRSEITYGVTSLTATQANPNRLLALVRGQWAIENGLHYRRDVTLGEDRCRTKHWNLAHGMAILNNLVLGLLLRYSQNVPQARRHYAAHPDEALRLVLSRPV